MSDKPSLPICKVHKIQEYQPECEKCRGEGWLEDEGDYGEWRLRPRLEKCWRCGGSGLAPWTVCDFCEEEAMMEEERERYL